MTELVRNRGSSVTVTVSRTSSLGYNRCESGKVCHRTQARTKSAGDGQRRALSSGHGFLGNDLLSPTRSSYRSRSSEPQVSARSKFIIPSITVTGVNSSPSSYSNDNSDTTVIKARSRSASPFDWIAREKLPCGSPTFERVKSDMFSDSDNSPLNSDTENTEAQRKQVKKKTSKSSSKTFQQKSYRKKTRSQFK